MGKNIRSSSSPKALATSFPMPPLADAMDAVRLSVDRFCLLAGVEALAEMMEGTPRPCAGPDIVAMGTVGVIAIRRARSAPRRPRESAAATGSRPCWQGGGFGELAGAARRQPVARVGAQPDGPERVDPQVPPRGPSARGRPGESAWRTSIGRFPALCGAVAQEDEAWLASDLSELDLLVDRRSACRRMSWWRRSASMATATSMSWPWSRGRRRTLSSSRPCSTISSPGGSIRRCPGCSSSMAEGAQQSDRNTFGVAAAIQRCHIHKGRNIIERLPLHLHASVKKRSVRPGTRTTQTRPNGCCATWPGVWSMRNRASRAASWRGWRRSSPSSASAWHELRRSLACTNIVENAIGTVRQVTRNVKRWRHAEMALRWTAAGLLEAQKTFRRLKAYRQLPILRNALQEHLRKAQADSAIETIMKAA